jgi:hypothetical protein
MDDLQLGNYPKQNLELFDQLGLICKPQVKRKLMMVEALKIMMARMTIRRH